MSAPARPIKSRTQFKVLFRIYVPSHCIYCGFVVVKFTPGPGFAFFSKINWKFWGLPKAISDGLFQALVLGEVRVTCTLHL
jgi:hypothetical protein